MEFVISGKVRLGRSERVFTKKVDAPSENMAREKVLSLFGSNNGVKRKNILIEKVEKHE